ncbi:MAG: hypothetical protein H7Z38_10885 [Rubrivivax sp.]|nr:hypothetical protein [Pyrinomonadaceae bacterium]
MFTRNRVTLNLEAGAADQFNHPIETEVLLPLEEQKRFPEEVVTTPVPTRVSSNTKLLGFERWRRHLQPFVGPKEF